ncbi:Alpha-aminoadipic semialdehyde synthase, mitochondrial [Smittium mucronatum]|uniref:Alpha-aminoadipic semialdehyde synthase, mitochondrial n=1 Tax=Smittium mucronatum TaxID=133383 RepID=A0A1R0GP60_9FUNG|nr:Alpha-aminoadipic semialdehyde synthase, mitochondrial [Smittium mucronatum]
MYYSTYPKSGILSVGIRREDKNIWERRSPLTPADVKRLIEETGTNVFIQPSKNRIYNDLSYEKAGALVSEDLGVADIILGIKEVPISKIIPDKTYAMFSHTHKVDYELIRDPITKKRLVMFGKYAGYAGMIDGVHGLGQKMLAMGYNSPFIHVGMSHVYPSLDSIKNHLKLVGKLIEENGVPKDFGPVVFTITGSGNVSQGVKEVFECLPHEYIEPKDLESFVKNYDGSFKYLNKVYGVKVNAKDYAYRKSDGAFDYNEYKSNPELYSSNFHEKIAPFTTLLVHGIFWNDKYPKLLTKKQLKKIKQDPKNKYRLITISDISCDIEGSIEFTNKASIIDKPFFYYDSIKDHHHQDKEGVQIMSIDNLPTELPDESSFNFSKLLYPTVLEMVKNNFENEILKNSIITESKKLKSEHSHLYDMLKKIKEDASKIVVIDNSLKKVLLAGSGMVTGPFIKYLEDQGNIEVSIASNNRKEAEDLSSNFKYTKVYDLDANNLESVDRLVSDNDIVVSMLPAPLHPIFAKSAIRHRKNMVTASYISYEMKSLDESAKNNGVTILNEIGLDPGIDHCSAMKIIDNIKDRGGKVKSFISWCGGLPAAENGNNPLGYKFSWSPRGVLTAGLNPAKFLLNKEMIEIKGDDLLERNFKNVPLFKGFSFEGLANRDSLSYIDVYGLNFKDLDSMLRGTLRFKGYSELMNGFSKLGFLDLKPLSENNGSTSFKDGSDFTNYVLGVRYNDYSSVTDAVSKKLGLSKDNRITSLITKSLKSFGLIGDTKDYQSYELTGPTVLDVFGQILQKNLYYTPTERDMVVLNHEFIAEFSSNEYELHSSSLVTYGTLGNSKKKGETAMARTVGIPAAIATKIILEKPTIAKGVIRPTIKEFYLPIMNRLDHLHMNDSIRFVEKVDKYESFGSAKYASIVSKIQ